jgi:hypothetical protein
VTGRSDRLATVSRLGVVPPSFPNGAFVVVAAAIVLAAIDIVAVPILLREQATDWRAYDEAARALAAGDSAYRWIVSPDVRAITDYPYLYPPPLAALWGLGLTATVFAILKAVSVAAIGTLARPALTGLAGWRFVAVGAALSGLALASPPALHDLILGNVMVLYLSAAVLVVAFPDRRAAAIPLGVLVAVALKPAIVPVLLCMLIRRRDQFIAAFASGLVTTLIFAAILGLEAYVDYLGALPRMGGLAQAFSGNLGLSAISLPLALVAIPIALGWTAWAALRRSDWTATAVALAMTQLVQPTLGLNYAALLIPAVIATWFIDRRLCAVLVVVVPFASIISPPLAGLIIATATSLADRPDRRGASSAPTVAVPAS